MSEQHTSELHAFQNAFARVLRGAGVAAPSRGREPPAPSDPLVDELARQPGFAVYRNTVAKACVDALQANYPAVWRLVGEEWFRAAAAVFVRSAPPKDPTLVTYGAGFPLFLERFAPARDLPYLGAVARLDRFWTEAHVARDEAPVAAADVAAVIASIGLIPSATIRSSSWALSP